MKTVSRMEEYKHVQQLSNDIFLQASANPQSANGASVAIGSLPSAGAANVNPTPGTNETIGVVKPKKKKKKTNLMPSLPSLRASLLPPPRHQCSQCHRNYGNRRDLRRHVLAHHQGIRYMCRLCGKIMMSSKSVRAHLKSSAHRLSNVDEIALNIEKVTPGSATTAGVNLPSNFAATTSTTNAGSSSATSTGKKST